MDGRELVFYQSDAHVQTVREGSGVEHRRRDGVPMGHLPRPLGA